ncbi:MAG: 4-alpha-glucanotransferase [Anaerolinea thermophila]|uniref:4-alpha-glucanotransferase n=1 Tax=Anaerolinea thermophila TaxID=167964 RepID=A0A117LH92_9CHLR|nr:MAG: 4-alpha-glucanotransferase [Anaerolinea thermophila]
MEFKRSSGILLHVSSLPGSDGIGDFGDSAYAFVEFLAATNTKFWQVLPLNPTGYGNSPYQGLSASAGNPLFISLDDLVELKLLSPSDLSKRPHFPRTKVNFGMVIPWKMEKLHKAFLNFEQSQSPDLSKQFKAFCSAQTNWLDDFALFMTIKDQHDLRAWDTWSDGLRFRDPVALRKFEKENRTAVEEQKFFQFIFFQQWKKLKKFANDKGIQIIGDIPIFVGYDCADTWTHPDLFYFDKEYKPTVVAGVPPDFFSRTGQLWGNPLYDWKKHKSSNYAWWIERIQNTLDMVDIIRLDHFRGFAGYYEIPAGSKTAEIGKWVKGPGNSLFNALYKHFGDLPFIAEDLGVMTPDVVELRERYQLPGMKIVQFGFNPNPEVDFQPHHLTRNSVAYTGTHDNETVKGWFNSLPADAKAYFKAYVGNTKESPSKAMVRLLWQSVSVFAIAPMQDLLDLGNEARMNFPGTLGNNWEWKLDKKWDSARLRKWLAEFNHLYSRD